MQFLYVPIEKTKNQRLSKKILIFFLQKAFKKQHFQLLCIFAIFNYAQLPYFRILLNS